VVTSHRVASVLAAGRRGTTLCQSGAALGVPVDTNSETWRAGEPERSTRTAILELLRSNRGQAFSVPEISEAVLGVDLEATVSETGELGPVIERLITAESSREGLRAVLTVHLSTLVYEGHAEVREIPNRDLPGEASEGTTPFYTASGE